MKHWRLAINNRLVAWAGVLGLGLMPCPDCGLPLAIKIWPAAGAVWLFRRWRQRNVAQLELLLVDDHLPAHEHDQVHESAGAD